MFWTDNMCIPMYAQNPKDAMVLMDYFYQPQVEAVVEYYNDYVCPVPDARQVLLQPDRLGGGDARAMRAGDRQAAVLHGRLAAGVPDAAVPGQVQELLPVRRTPASWRSGTACSSRSRRVRDAADVASSRGAHRTGDVRSPAALAGARPVSYWLDQPDAPAAAAAAGRAGQR